jgi:hypothetical protein
MKQVYILLLLFACTTGKAENRNPFNIFAISNELDSANGSISIKFTYLFNDTITYSDSFAVQLPCASWQLISIGSLSGSSFLPGDSASRTIIVSYPLDSIPFYAHTITVCSYPIVQSKAVSTPLASGSAKVYFTPYNTVEVWNSSEFARLKRYWFSDKGYKPRIFVNRDSIPQSNIPDDFIPTEEWQEDFQVAFVEGLGYAVPMMATHPDSLHDYVWNDSVRADGCGWSYKRFQGTVSGNIFTTFQNPGVTTNVGLAGVKVEIWEQDDLFFSIRVGQGVSDEQGNYSIWVNTCQWVTEGSNCELFVKVIAKNDQYDIKGFTGCWPFLFASVHVSPLDVSWPYNDGDPLDANMGTEFIGDESHKAVYLARNAYRFFNESYNGSNLPVHLNIQTDINALEDAGFFLPNSYSGVPASVALAAAQIYLSPYTVLLTELSCLVSGINLNSIIYTPTIYLGYGGTDGENLLYHEFGHFVMWHLNYKKWTHIFTGSFADHNERTESNIRIAFNEGWGDAFSMMVDAYFRNIDNEYNSWSSNGQQNYEDRRINNQVQDGVLLSIDDINFGVGSEFFIACALYDLWDGPLKLNGETEDQFNDVNNNQTTQPNRWRNGEFDDVELSFTEMANAIRYGIVDEATSNDVNVVSSVQSYYYNLIRYKTCDEARNIKKVFDQNRVVGSVDNFPNGDYQGFSSDDIWENQFIANNAGDGFDFYFKHDVNVIQNPLPLRIVGNSTNNLEYANISDRLQIPSGSSLYFNAIGSQFAVDNILPSDNEMLMATVCTQVTNQGLIYLGHTNDPSSQQVAEVTFIAGSSLTLQAGSTLRVRPHSRVIFEQGSTFTYNGGAIILEGDDSFIDIRGNFNIGNNATFTFTGNGHILRTTPWGGPSFTAGTNSRFVLDGNGKTDLVLVTNGWMVQPPDNLVEFNITNGKVECDQSGGLNIGCACTIDNVLITRRSDLTTPYPHSGLNIYNQQEMVQGQPVSTAHINDVEIEHGWRGFVAIPWDVIPEISNVYIHDCDESLLTINAGITMTNVHLENNVKGWLALNMSMPSYGDNLVIEQSDSYGMSYDATSSSPLSLNGPNIHHNGQTDADHGIILNGNTDCFIRCGSVSNNFSSGISVQVKSALHLDGYAEVGIVANGGAGINLKMARDLLLNVGYNGIYNNMDYQVKGAIENNSYCSHLTLPADNNQWNIVGGNYAPQSGIDYNLNFICPVGNQQMMFYQGYIDDDDPEDYVGCRGFDIPKPETECIDCRLLTINGTTKALNEWVNDAEGNIGRGTSLNTSAFSALHHILMLQSTWTSDESRFIRKAYHLAGQAYGYALYGRETHVPRLQDFANNDSSAIYYLMNQAINDKKLIDPIYAPDSLSRGFDQMLSSAASYTIAQQLDSANAELDGLEDISVALMEQVRNRWQCVASALQQYRDGLIRRDEVADLALSCAEMYRLDLDDENYQLASNSTRVITYPNPSDGKVIIRCEGIAQGELTIEIFDNLGRLCQRHNCNATSSTFFKSINLKDLPAGTYHVKIATNSTIENARIVLAR